MTNKEIKRFVSDRDTAFIAAVTQDDWEPVRKYCRKYGVKLPKDEDVMKAGIYKAVQECTNIPAEVKYEAAVKCRALGFKPTMWG